MAAVVVPLPIDLSIASTGLRFTIRNYHHSSIPFYFIFFSVLSFIYILLKKLFAEYSDAKQKILSTISNKSDTLTRSSIPSNPILPDMVEKEDEDISPPSLSTFKFSDLRAQSLDGSLLSKYDGNNEPLESSAFSRSEKSLHTGHKGRDDRARHSLDHFIAHSLQHSRRLAGRHAGHIGGEFKSRHEKWIKSKQISGPSTNITVDM
jgi:hypothetical protein